MSDLKSAKKADLKLKKADLKLKDLFIHDGIGIFILTVKRQHVFGLHMLLTNRLWIYDHRRCFFLPKRRSKLSIPVISALHPGRLTAGSPTNHPFRKNGK